MDTMPSNIVYLENVPDDGLGPPMNHVIFNDLLEFQMKNNPSLAGKTRRDIAEACCMSESTLKNMCSGKNNNPRIGTLKCILRHIGGGSIDRLVGFAPPRDFAKEEAEYDASLVEAVQIRLDEKRAIIEEQNDKIRSLENELTRLRKIILEKGEAHSKSTAEASALEREIQEHKHRIERRDRGIKMRNKVIMIMAAFLIVLFVADIMLGEYGWFRFGPIK